MNLTRFLTSCIALLLLGASPVLGQIIPDRPDFTDSPVVVPKGFVQLETGFTYTSFGGADAFQIGEALVRIPVSDRLEARLGVPNYIVNDGPGPDGFADSFLGAKYQLGPTVSGWDMALVGAVTLPTGEDALSSDSVDPSAAFVLGRSLTHRVGVTGQIAAAFPERGGERRSDISATLVSAIALSDRASGFIELAGFGIEEDTPDVRLHAGLLFPVNSNFQLDVHGGFGLSDISPDSFVGVGLAYRR